jgi:type VI secretion system ImpM family protein
VSVGAFGKVPHAGDFVRHNVVAASALAFEHLVQAGVDLAARDGTIQRSDDGAMFGFVFAPSGQSTGELLAGVILPSHDAVGRRNPFVVFSTLSDGWLAASPHLAPLALGEFLAGAADVAYAAQEGESKDIGALLAGLQPPTNDKLQQHRQDYDQWTHATRAAVAFRGTFGEPYLWSAAHALETILQCVDAWRGVEHPETPLAARLPISASGVGIVAFWMDLLRRAARWHHTIPSAFWSWDGDYGEMLLHVGAVPPGSIGQLWAPDDANEHVCDLTAEPVTPLDLVLERLPPGIARALRSPETLVADLLVAITH